MNYERLLSLSPDIVLLFGVSGASAMEPKLRELGISTPIWASTSNSRRWARPNGSWP